MVQLEDCPFCIADLPCVFRVTVQLNLIISARRAAQQLGWLFVDDR